MKPQNIQYLAELEENYKKFQKVLETKNQQNLTIGNRNQIANEISELSLTYLAKISEIIEWKYGKWKEAEEKAVKILQKFVDKHENIKENLKKIGIENGKIPEIENLLDRIIVKITNILDENSIKIPNIYRKNSSEVGIQAGSGEWMEELKIAEKYETLIKILNDTGMDFNNVQILTESINPERMRKIPYKIVYILGNNPTTITISNEIGQATYVFHDYIEPNMLVNAEKWQPIQNIAPIKVTYSETNFEENLKNAIFNSEKIAKKSENTENNSRENILESLDYHTALLNIIPELVKIGLEVDENGVLDFENLEGHLKWPKINGKNLMYFPSVCFNQNNKIGNTQWVIQNKKDLAKIFEFFGFQIITEEQRLEKYKKHLENIIPELIDKGLEMDENGILDFENLEAYSQRWKDGEMFNNWPEINGKWPQSFPSSAFNQKNKIGNKKWAILNPQELAKLFEFFGFSVITKEQRLEKYKSQLEGIIPELEKIGLEVDENGILDFENLEGVTKKWENGKDANNWPLVNGKTLQCFPSTYFNQKNWIGNKKWVIQGIKELTMLFEFFGFPVITEGQRFQKYKSQLANIIPALIDKGLKVDENGILDFKNLQGVTKKWENGKNTNNWPLVNGKRLQSFPSKMFNEANKIWTKDWRIFSPQELSKLFALLGFPVKKED